MRVIKLEKTVYSFSELSDHAKEKARDWFRQGFEFSFHAECIMDDAKVIGKILGIKIDKIYYSGFWSQGDGACFTGRYAPENGAIKNIKEHAPNDQKIQDIALLLQLSSPLTATIEHHGHYYHSGCMKIFCESEDDGSHEKEVELLEDGLKAFADWIYSRLEKEYEYQLSDEQVDEEIAANEYEFTEDGRIA